MYKSIPWIAPIDVSVARHYPERADHDDPWYDRVANAVLQWTVRPAQRWDRERGDRLGAIVRASAPHVRGLRKLSDDELRARAATVRGRLIRKGIGLATVGESFALVREVARRTVGARHYAVQMMGAYALLQGRLVEMATGEGKTLTASLAAATAALTRIPTHVVTVNDYLARRDAEEMGPIYAFLGLKVGCVMDGMPSDARKQAYASDVTYCSNKELAFDYLRDSVMGGGTRGGLRAEMERLRGTAADRGSALVLNGLYFAIVDEADSIFVDEARTPLILSPPLGEPENRDLYETALDLARGLTERQDFVLDRRRSQAELRGPGRSRLAGLVQGLPNSWQLERIREDRIKQALCALHLYQRDQHYLVREEKGEEKVVLIAEGTGRVLDSHAWEGGLHQMVECKENVPLTPPRQTVGRLTYQRLFRRYILLSGMTGTAKEVVAEVRDVYGLDVVRIPLKRRLRRSFRGATLCESRTEKWNAVVDAARRVVEDERRPVLIGTRTVKDSEELTERLRSQGIAHALLNAKNDKEEADIVKQAGESARITVATNMAGRGTDIRLAPGIATRGGLHVILTECHESRRIDRQLFGRCARQGDPGSCEMIVSLEDELFRTNAKSVVQLVERTMRAGRSRSQLVARMLRYVAQSVAEKRNARIRKQVFKQGREIDRLMSFSGTGG